MKYEPGRVNRVPLVTVLFLLAAAAVPFAFSLVPGIAGKGILQILSICFLCGAIFVLVRYQFTRVRYLSRLRDGAIAEGALSHPPKELEFVVERATGRRAFIAECVLPLDSLTSCVPLPADRRERTALMKKYKGKTYRYLANMVGGDRYLLVFHEEAEEVKIEIEADEKLAEYLAAVARYERENEEQE